MENQKNDYEFPAEEQASSEDEIVKLATIGRWAEVLGVSDSAIRRQIHAIGIIGITGKNVKGRLLPHAYYVEADVRAACVDLLLPKLPETGIFNLNGIPAIGTSKYALYTGIACDTLRKAITAALKPLGKAKSGTATVDLYDKSQVDALPCFAPELPETGILDFNGIPAIGENKYVLHRCISYVTLRKAISAADLKPIGKARSGKKTIDLYNKSQVDSLPCFLSQLSESGIFKLNGNTVISVNKYSKHRDIKNATLRKAITATGLIPLGKAKSGSQTIDLYDKSQVDALSCFAPELPTTGIIDLNGVLAIGVSKYAQHRGIAFQALRDAVQAAEMKSIGKAISGPATIDLYKKSQVDALSCFAPELPTTGIIDLNGVLAIGVSKYAQHRGIAFQALRDAVQAADLKSIGNAISGTHTIDLYDKSQVDALPCFYPELPETGILTFSSIQAIGENKYARYRGISRDTLHGVITAAGLKPIGEARSGNRTIDLYDKSQVDALPCFYPELPETGILELSGIQVIGVNKYVQYRGINVQTLHRAIIAIGLMPIGRARSGRQTIDLYDKAQVDALITSNAHKWKNLKNTEDVPDPQKANGESEE